MTKVLLVDDDATQLKLGAIRLRDAGFEVMTANGGDEAMRRATLDPPDVVMSDVLMGDIDGFGLCRALRSDPSLVHMPIILLSAHYKDQPDQRLAETVGAYALVTRTPEFSDELAALHAALERHTPAVAPSDASYEAHLRTNAQQLSRMLGRARNAEAQYRALFQQANDAIALLTHEGIIVEANDRWLALTGIDLVGRHIGTVVADADAARALVDATGHSPAVAITTAHGRPLFLQFSTSSIELDGQPTVLAIGRDVTEDVFAAQRLAAAELKYRSLVERLPDVIWTSANGKLTFVTQNAERMLGFTPEEMIAESIADRVARIHPHDRESTMQSRDELVDHGVMFDVEYRQRKKDGSYVWVRNRATASYERDGVRYIEGLATDITERKRLEEGLRHAQKMEAIGQLSGGIAHDFNNILAVILGCGRFLAEDLADQDPRREDALEIITAAERAAALTRQLLAFSRHQVLEPQVVDLDVALAGIQKMLGRLIGEDITLVVDRQHASGTSENDERCARVDLGQLEQVLVNLVVNARDAMPAGGKLVIATGQATLEHRAATELGLPVGDYVTLSVSDTGVGIDPVTRCRIFEPFFTTKDIGRGTGLGLSTCYGIIQQSGGHIAVTSEPNQGSTFVVYLPRVEQEPLRAEPKPRHALNGSETILLVEDDERLRATIQRMLVSRGYRLIVATSADDALALARRHRTEIDLVLTDVVMPGCSGPDLVADIEAELGAMRTLYMSGYTDHPALRNGMAAGINFLQKPFTIEVLARKLRDALTA